MLQNWITFNEPQTFCRLGYGIGIHAPGLKLGNEVYKCGHNVLRSHARTVQYFRQKFGNDGHKIGITLDMIWAEPLNPNLESDRQAAQSFLEAGLSWFADPVYFGDYPQSLKTRFPNDLPQFTEEEKQLLKGSSDFFGLNFYTAVYVTGTALEPSATVIRNGVPIGPQAESTWLFVVPWGFRKMLKWIHDRYALRDRQQGIIVTENGVSAPKEQLVTSPVGVTLEDTFRVQFYQEYLNEMMKAINEDGVKVSGYFAWSLMDNFEWADGYQMRFGTVSVDFDKTYARTPKRSAYFLGKFFSRIQQ
ncbi:hypothetical protein HK102_003775 [Quaeritorhiza haematococci]|nr:hypothetical protein HK102_003775 [Quaeritorhiza haematococci]